ncbi:MAG: N-formylglutamate amidohydrolase [Magnetovibrio sp.]|nr:N-formylglutamate amidohydrolase [Magnetovibrio sp.]
MREHTSFGATSIDVELVNATGKGGIVFVCEHASNFIPNEFTKLGLSEDALKSHIAWDPGAFAVAKILSAMFDAPLVAPVVSRLVYDCNRPAQVQSCVPVKSENYDIPGNIGLSDADRQKRAELFYQPYRKALVNTIEAAQAAERSPAIVTIHSFTPVYQGQQRDLDLGILHDTDTRLADQFLTLIEDEGQLTARRNDPYGPQDGVTYTLAEHAVPRGLLNTMIEIRNDLIADENTQHDMANRLAGYLRAALVALNVDVKGEVSP